MNPYFKSMKMLEDQIREQIKELKRGTVEIYSEKELEEKLLEAAKLGKQLRVKLGMDPTAPDIHLGHTVVLRKLRQFQDMGHKAVLIIGDYTARIGDPSGQNTSRPVLDGDQIEANAKTYFQQACKILDTDHAKLEVRPNSEWLSKIDLVQILKLASSMTVARMLERDTFEIRYKKGDPIGIHEFLYPLMQGYDSVIIESDVELGGTDQTFNNLVGRDMQKLHNQKPQVVITMPILVGLDGVQKMSKSKHNYIGVTESPNEMFGKVMSISDEMMKNYFTLLTNLSEQEINLLVDNTKTHPKQAKVTLAKEIIKQFYTQSDAENAAAEFDKIFAQKELPTDIDVIEISSEELPASKLILECNMAESGGEAKRLIKQGGLSIDNAKITDPNQLIKPQQDMIVKVGKRKFARLTIR